MGSMLRMRTMITLAAAPLVEVMKSELKARVQAVQKKLGRKPKLAVVLVGDDPGSVIYTRKKGERAIELGMDHTSLHFAGTVTPDEVQTAIQRLNLDPTVDGILVQRPLPKSFNEEEVAYWVDPKKDVDAFHPENTGRLVLGLPCFKPCTPAGMMRLLAHYGISPSGKVACVVGRSSIVGRPMASLLLQANATVIQAHSKTPDLAAVTSQADLLVVAAGKSGLIGAQHVKPGAIVLDVGIHRDDQGKVSGDVRFDEVSKKASALSPVPGGVGPMTIMMLLENTVWSAEHYAR